jgi:hypothetical protein
MLKKKKEKKLGEQKVSALENTYTTNTCLQHYFQSNIISNGQYMLRVHDLSITSARIII